jgi:hypothetical protein
MTSKKFGGNYSEKFVNSENLGFYVPYVAADVGLLLTMYSRQVGFTQDKFDFKHCSFLVCDILNIILNIVTHFSLDLFRNFNNLEYTTKSQMNTTKLNLMGIYS